MKELCLVSCSGGLDSSTTLAILKLAGYQNIIACHFDYGCRSGEAEKIAITNICKELDIPLKIFDISNIYETVGTKGISMLQDKNVKVTTATSDDIKTTCAWTPNRNGLFMNIMVTLAEAEVMKYDYDKVYLMGGFLNLTESGCFIPGSNVKILTSDNKEVPCTNIKVGDKVMSFNFYEKELEPSIIKDVIKTSHDKVYELYLTCDEGAIHGKKILSLSKEHPLYIRHKGWTEAQNVKIGDICFAYRECEISHGGWVVEDIKVFDDGPYEMMNYHCEPNNNFFINKIFTHNTYPDNSEYFLSTQLESYKYSTLIGNRIYALYGLCDLMKYEQYAIIKHFGLDSVLKHAISCDQAIVDENGIPRNCSKNGIPCCGSGLLSYWAAKMVGMDDMKIRQFYKIDSDIKQMIPRHISEQSEPINYNIHQIIDRIHLPKDKLDNLHQLLQETTK